MEGSRALDWAEFVDAIGSPFALEEHSVVHGAVLLQVYLEEGAAGVTDPSAFSAALASLPCVTVALASRPLDAAEARLAAAFDVVVAPPPGPWVDPLSSSREQLIEQLDRAVAASPLASLALVQLVRLSSRLDLGGGLWAESLAYSTLQSGPEFRSWLRNRPASRPWETPPRPPVRVARREAEIEVILDHPEVRNALDTAMRDALVEVLRAAHFDDSISRIVLRGAGPSFCSGGDLRQFGTFPDPATAHAVRATRSPAWWVAAERDRITALVHGPCVGAGIELPAFVHHVVADPAATFQLPELAFGLVPGAGGTVSVPRRIGRHRAVWMGLTGTVIDAQTALAWGLVDDIAPVAPG